MHQSSARFFFVGVIICLLGFVSFQASAQTTTPAAVPFNRHEYHIDGASITCDGKPIVVRGIDAMHVFDTRVARHIFAWPGICIIREFVGDLQFEDISDYPRKQYASFISGVEQSGNTTLPKTIYGLDESFAPQGLVNIEI